MKEIFTRTSVRQFHSRKVEPEKVQQLLRAAMAAPSAGNQQPWEFYVVTQPEVLEELARCSPYAVCLKDAPLGIVICWRKDCPMPEYAQIDCSAAAENLLLEAVAQGLGGIWLGIAPLKERMEAARQVLQLPGRLEVFPFIACGYPLELRAQQDRYDSQRVHIFP